MNSMNESFYSGFHFSVVAIAFVALFVGVAAFANALKAMPSDKKLFLLLLGPFAFFVRGALPEAGKKIALVSLVSLLIALAGFWSVNALEKTYGKPSYKVQ